MLPPSLKGMKLLGHSGFLMLIDKQAKKGKTILAVVTDSDYHQEWYTVGVGSSLSGTQSVFMLGTTTNRKLQQPWPKKGKGTKGSNPLRVKV